MVSSLLILASSVCKSLQYLISALTQEGEGSHLFGCTCSVVLWRGRDTANKCHWCVGEGAHSVCTTLGLPQSKVACASQVYTIQAPGFSARTLSQVSLAFCALPRMCATPLISFILSNFVWAVSLLRQMRILSP